MELPAQGPARNALKVLGTPEMGHEEIVRTEARLLHACVVVHHRT